MIGHTVEGAYEQWRRQRSTRTFNGAERREPDSEQVALNLNIGGAQERKYSGKENFNGEDENWSLFFDGIGPIAAAKGVGIDCTTGHRCSAASFATIFGNTTAASASSRRREEAIAILGRVCLDQAHAKDREGSPDLQHLSCPPTLGSAS